MTVISREQEMRTGSCSWTKTASVTSQTSAEKNGAEATCGGRLFQVHEAATVDHHVMVQPSQALMKNVIRITTIETEKNPTFHSKLQAIW